MNILVKVSGSIAAYKICSLVSQLKKDGHQVKIAASKSSLNFVGEAAWEALSGNPVFLNDFSPQQRMDHIYLNDWAEIIFAPATAQSLNAIAQGVGSSVITTLFLARDKSKPYLIFPAMNPRMWNDKKTQESIKFLKTQKNISIYEPASGLMACGHEGQGRLLEPNEILDKIYSFQYFDKKVLITFGGTTENIDGVRSISNFSSGNTGKYIAQELKKKFKVTALIPKNMLDTGGLEGVEKFYFTSSLSLEENLFELIGKQTFDSVIHLAAISDFIPDNKTDKKISSDGNLEIKFIKNKKVLNYIKEQSLNKNIRLVSFKLTHNQSQEEIESKIMNQFKLSGSDFIVHNELSQITSTGHKFSIYKPDMTKADGSTKENLAEELIQILERK